MLASRECVLSTVNLILRYPGSILRHMFFLYVFFVRMIRVPILVLNQTEIFVEIFKAADVDLFTKRSKARSRPGTKFPRKNDGRSQ